MVASQADAMVAWWPSDPSTPGPRDPPGSAKAAGRQAGLLQQWTFEDPSARVLQLLLFSPVGIAANQGGAALDLGALVDQVFGLAKLRGQPGAFIKYIK